MSVFNSSVLDDCNDNMKDDKITKSSIKRKNLRIVEISDDEKSKNAIIQSAQLHQSNVQLIPNNLLYAEKSKSSRCTPSPSIGSLAVLNSSDVTIGNKTYINGQIVIKNIFHHNPKDFGKDGTHNECCSPKFKTIILENPTLFLMILAVIIIMGVIAVFTLTVSVPDEPQSEEKSFEILNRSVWLAQPLTATIDLLELPIKRVIIAHTVSDSCLSQKSCIFRIRLIQEQHIVDDYGDIGYNFLIGGDGNAYEGRGWHKMGAFLIGQNSKSYGVAFIGDYRYLEPTEEQMTLLNNLLRQGTDLGVLTLDYKLYGARQWQQTISPGDLLYNRLKNHSHFSED